MKERNAERLCADWNRILLEGQIEVCSDALKGAGILEVKILKLAWQNPSFRIKDYLNRLEIPNSTFTNTLNRLVKKGLAKREMDEQDLRSYGISLTKEGRCAVEAHFQKEKDLLAVFLNRLEEEEQEVFLSLFEKMIAKDKDKNEDINRKA